ncbi:MAG: hypothetical protein P8L23_01260 [Flavobacteriales bacterium]|nr:hypothetical protein [Flavobacteriales bacterium]
MDIKKTLLIGLLLLSVNFYGQGFETQKKFSLPEEMNFEDFIKNSQKVNEFYSFYHSQYLYYDLYIDNEEGDLFQMEYSLRFRKRIINDSVENYTFQLKDEMSLGKEIRMEIEEKELDFYNVIYDKKWVPLTAVLDTVFELYNDLLTQKDSNSFFKNLFLIEKWIKTKANGPIAPFQKLRHIDSVMFNEKKISSFKPVLVGSSIRKRAHIYVDSEYTTQQKIPFNRKNKEETPMFFQENTQYNWLFESSLDYSNFVYLVNFKKTIVKEYEVENKFISPEKGQELLNKHEKTVLEKLELAIKYDSKFKQSIQHFNKQ